MHRFAYLQAETVTAAAAALAAHPEAVLKAGGVDLLDFLKEQIITPSLVVDISHLSELRQIEMDQTTGAGRIGTLATLAQVSQHAAVQQHWPALAQAAAHAATPQIRSLATLGGNLCQRG